VASKPTLSRDYVYVPLANMNVPVASLTVYNVAFMDPGQEPADEDWHEAIPVDLNHDLYVAKHGESLAILVGPARGDDVDSLELSAGDYQVWVDVAADGSDERVVRVAGTFTISATG